MAMRVVTARYKHPTPPRPGRRRIAVRTALALVTVAVLANILLAVWYHGHTYPHTTLGMQSVGGRTFGAVEALAASKKILPEEVTLTAGDARSAHRLAALGILRDTSRTTRSLRRERSWLPVIAVFQKHRLDMPVRTDNDQASKSAGELESIFHADPVNARVSLQQAAFTAVAPQDGHNLDKSALAGALLTALDKGQKTIAVPTKRIAPAVSFAQAQKLAAALQKTLSSSVTVTYGAGHETFAPAAIAAWYMPDGPNYKLDDFAIRTAVAQSGITLGVHASNLSDVVSKIKQAVATHGKTTAVLTSFAQTKTYRYCVSSRGGAAANGVADLKAKLVSTYADLRGWSLDGQVQFVYAESDCNFTVWLSTPDQMSSFGAICDPYWNCEAENNVVVNLDRWLGATPAWQAAGGNLADYRVMLINHETGHMLGFGHNTCPGSGQPAPVMMQQSIDLQGCKFNIWPVNSELDSLRATLGL